MPFNKMPKKGILHPSSKVEPKMKDKKSFAMLGKKSDQKKKKGINTGPSEKFMSKFGMNG